MTSLLTATPQLSPALCALLFGALLLAAPAYAQVQTDSTAQDRIQMQSDPQMGGVAGVETTADYRTRLDGSSSWSSYDRVANERFDAYDEGLGRMSDRLGTLPENERARATYDLIRLRGQYDDLVDRRRRMRSSDFDAMRGDFTRDLTRFDEEYLRMQNVDPVMNPTSDDAPGAMDMN